MCVVRIGKAWLQTSLWPSHGHGQSLLQQVVMTVVPSTLEASPKLLQTPAAPRALPLDDDTVLGCFWGGLSLLGMRL